jgi:hypothetical protein
MKIKKKKKRDTVPALQERTQVQTPVPPKEKKEKIYQVPV